ncbi:MAG: extracellular solute-binding protein [bacterium]|nr:extracellular solute-binding protein [bacterium]
MTIIHAGSLTVPFRELEGAFERLYDIDVRRDVSGSLSCVRKITELQKSADLIALSDHTLFRDLLIPRFVDNYIPFAKNEMVIVYTDKSIYAEEINANNWYEVLTRGKVRLAHSDPNCDPCGYRALLVWKLAEKHYKILGLYDMLKRNCPEKNIRPKETDLVALIEVGEIDYAFIYRSIAKQHRLKFIELPPEINLSEKDFADFYKEVGIRIKGKRQNELIEKHGEPIVYGIGILKDALNKEAASSFIEFLLSDKGKEIIRECGQKPILKSSFCTEE